jgi:hypothetical protein
MMISRQVDDQRMGDSKNKLKVVDEKEVRPEEVVRLDAPGKKPLTRQGKMAPEVMRPVAEAVKEARSGADPKQSAAAGQEWSGHLEGKENKAIPIGWFFLVGFALVGVVVWMIVQIVTGKADPGPQGAGVEEGKQGVGTVIDFRDRQAAESHLEELNKVLAGFLAAGSVEERLAFVRHPERVRPLMEDHYGRESLQSYQDPVIRELSPISLALQSFIVMVVDTREEDGLPLLVEDGPDGLRVDWESFVCYQPISPERFAAERPSEPVSLRAYASLDHFFVYQFADEKKYGCLRLEFRDSDTVLFGYVERGSVVEQKFNQILSQTGTRTNQPMILRLRFPEECPEKRCVVVEDVESPLWAYPTNPRDEETK